jgi:hypothetical protein
MRLSHRGLGIVLLAAAAAAETTSAQGLLHLQPADQVRLA